MALPEKGRRTLQLEGKSYFWRLGDEVRGFANLAVQAPTGRVWVRRLRVRSQAGDPIAVTPADAIQLIRDNEWETR